MAEAAKTAVVTGGGRGIGRGIVLALAQDGCDVAILDLIEENAQAVKKEVEALGRRALTGPGAAGTLGHRSEAPPGGGAGAWPAAEEPGLPAPLCLQNPTRYGCPKAEATPSPAGPPPITAIFFPFRVGIENFGIPPSLFAISTSVA